MWREGGQQYCDSCPYITSVTRMTNISVTSFMDEHKDVKKINSRAKATATKTARINTNFIFEVFSENKIFYHF